MAEYLIQDTTLTGIANAIRQKSGAADAYTPAQMADAIAAIQTGGGEVSPVETGFKLLLERGSDLTGSDGAIVWPQGLTKIGSYALYNRTYATSDNFPLLPDSVKTISSYAFQNCKKLNWTRLPDELESVGYYAFQYCEALALTELPSKLQKINPSAFQSCKTLAITDIPASVTHIQSSAFNTCTSMTSLTFHSKPITISSTAFSNTLTEIRVPWAEGALSGAPWGANNATIIYNYTGG